MIITQQLNKKANITIASLCHALALMLLTKYSTHTSVHNKKPVQQVTHAPVSN